MYYLLALILAAVGLSIFGSLHFKPLYIIISTLILVIACWTVNKIFARVFRAPENSESSVITGLILALIITPNPTGFGITFLLAAAGLAMASKYILTIKKKHIFNPAAIAVVLTALGAPPKRQLVGWSSGYAAFCSGRRRASCQKDSARQNGPDFLSVGCCRNGCFFGYIPRLRCCQFA
jgi:Na+-transporting NADH:ubiquinone oxidoreductase subunit NqrB